MPSKRLLRTWLVVAAAVLVAVFNYLDSGRPVPGTADGGDGAAAIAAAYDAAIGDLQVESAGIVTRVLPDDRTGSRHQRFILRLDNDIEVLVAHNIDLAPRIAGLRKGDAVEFFGEYEWNDKGGVIHWTHHDPAGRHVDGWLRHDGRLYQ
jgi:hypothetical protein